MRSTGGVTTPTYDEFGLFHQNAEEFGIELHDPPVVERVSVDVGGGAQISALRWGRAAPELVLLHGGAQNAHTWDTVALALDRPLVAIDLPGHGHSSHRDDHVYWPADNAVASKPRCGRWRPTRRSSSACRWAGSPRSRSPIARPMWCVPSCSSM